MQYILNCLPLSKNKLYRYLFSYLILLNLILLKYRINIDLTISMNINVYILHTYVIKFLNCYNDFSLNIGL